MKRQKISKGFTVFELLIVIVILSLLYTIAAFYTAGLQNEAKIAKAKGDLKTLELAINGYLKDKEICPPEENYQTSLLLSNPNILDKNLMDPFGATINTVYSYSSSNNQKYYVAYSVGIERNGYVSVSDDGMILVEGAAIYETNGYFDAD